MAVSSKTILLCAGGTGGHLFPAEALAHVLVKRGYKIHLAVDDRAGKFAGEFPAEKIHQVKSATLGSKNPVSILKTLLKLFNGYRQSKALLKAISPVAVVGFGGYPTVPPLLAASRNGVPTLIHEANAVLGRANRFLSSRVDQVAIGFGNTDKVQALNYRITGNPVRPAVLEGAGQPYPVREAGERFRLLVFGGSLGARFFSEIMPAACELLDARTRSCLGIVQQAREEDMSEVIAAYKEMGIEAEVAPFFQNMASHIADAHLVISRAGASTVSELAVIGRPAVLVPYPFALDHDQAANAQTVERAGGVKIYNQRDLTPELLADELRAAMNSPKKLALAAKNAKKTGIPNAAAVLADCVEALIDKA